MMYAFGGDQHRNIRRSGRVFQYVYNGYFTDFFWILIIVADQESNDRAMRRKAVEIPFQGKGPALRSENVYRRQFVKVHRIPFRISIVA